MDFKEKTLSSEYLYKGKILDLKRDKVVLPDGKQGVREIVEHHGGSAILCERDGKILFVRQFRYAYGEELWEIPAGKLNAGEDPAKTAKRELEEESGIIAENVSLLFTVYPSPGYTSEIIRIYRGEGLSQGEIRLDKDEFLSSRWIDAGEVKEMIKRGEIKDAKTLIALAYALNGFGENK